jgi:hypothetical protein
MSHSQVGRIERGETQGVSIDQAARLATAVGLSLVVRTYPVGDPIRDAGHAALLDRFAGELHPSLRWRTEVPIDVPGDLRTWDGVLSDRRRRLPVEAETRVADVQAMQRRIALKQRDDGVDGVILLLAATAANRRVLTAAGSRAQRAGSGRAAPTSERRAQVEHLRPAARRPRGGDPAG